MTADGQTYFVVIPTPVVKQLPTRPASGSSRIHVVAAKIVNSAATETSSVKRELQLYIEPGNAAPSPTEPTIPVGHLRLYRLAQPSGSDAIGVTPVAPRTVAVGGVLPVANAAERDALTAVWDGLMVYREDADVLDIRLNGAWRPTQVGRTTRGIRTATTNSQGQIVIPHGLGTTPTWIGSPVALFSSIWSAFVVDFDATNITVTIRNSSVSGTPAVANQQVPVSWSAGI